jgi:hypothetical protein
MCAPSPELGLSHPLSRLCAPPPGTQGGGGTLSCGEGQFRRLEKRLSTLPTLLV